MPERELGLDHAVHEAAGGEHRRRTADCCATAAARTTGRRCATPPGRSGSCTPPCNRSDARPEGMQPGDDDVLDRVGVGERGGSQRRRADRSRPGASPACRAARRPPPRSASGVIGAPAYPSRPSAETGRYARRRMLRPNVDQRKSADPRRRRASDHRGRVHRDDRRRRGQGRRRLDSARALPLLVQGRPDHRRRRGAPATTTRSCATRSPTAQGQRVHRLDRVLCGSLPSDPSDALVAAVDRDLGRDAPTAGAAGGDGTTSPSTRSR